MEIINDPAISAELSNMSYTGGLNSGSAVDDFAKKDLQDKMSIYDKLYGSGTGLGTGLGGRTNPQNQRLTQDEILARKQDRQQVKAKELVEDDSNTMIKLKEAYNAVNNLWGGTDLQANYMGKKQVMSNKIFEDVGHSMAESEIERQKLIDQYNNSEDDPNAKQKVYQLRIKDGVDENGNPIYTYKTGLAETSAADRYKNQVKAQGYEILSEKGMANAEDWENKWHGNKANLADRTFDNGYNSKGKNIKDISNFGEGYSEIYNTQHFNIGESQDDINANMQKSIALQKAMEERKASGYGKGSDSMIDAFQAGAVKLGLDTADTALDILTPGDNTFLDEARKQENIDKFVGYNRKTADKAIGEATARFNNGNYAGALWEVLKNPQIMTESLPAMAEMTLGFGKFTTAGKALTALGDAKKLNNLDKIAEAQKAVDDLTNTQKAMYKVADNAGFLTQVMSETNNQIEQRVQNNAEAGVKGGDSYGEIAGVFASEFLNLGIDRFAFDKITGIEGGKLSLEKAFDLLDASGKAAIAKNVAKTISGLAADGAIEGAQEYIQTWGEILNTQLGTAKNGTLEKIFNDKENQDETVGAMLAGAGSGVHMAAGADAIGYTKDKTLEAFGKVTKDQQYRNNIQDMANINDILDGENKSHFEGLTGEDGKISPDNIEKVRTNAREKLDSIGRSGANFLYSKAIEPEISSTDENGNVVPDTKLKDAVKSMVLGTHDLLFDQNFNASMATPGGAVEPEFIRNRIEFENKVSTTISKLVSALDTVEAKTTLVKQMQEDPSFDPKNPDGTDKSLEDIASTQLNNKKLQIINAVGELFDDNRIDDTVKNRILQDFKEKMIEANLNKLKQDAIDSAKKKAKQSANSGSTVQDSEKIDASEFDISQHNVKEEIDAKAKKLAEDDPIFNPETVNIDAKQKENLERLAEALYSIGGKSDKELGDLINDLKSSKQSEDGTFKLNSIGTVSDHIMNTGFRAAVKNGERRSIKDYDNEIGGTLDSLNARNSEVKVNDTSFKRLDGNIKAFINFMNSRLGSNLTDNYGLSKSTIEKLSKDERTNEKSYEFVANKIKNEYNSITREDGSKQDLKRDDNKALQDYLATPKNQRITRQLFIGGATKPIMSLFNKENQILIERADRYARKLSDFLVLNGDKLTEEQNKELNVTLGTLRDYKRDLEVKNGIAVALWKNLNSNANYNANLATTSDEFKNLINEESKKKQAKKAIESKYNDSENTTSEPEVKTENTDGLFGNKDKSEEVAIGKESGIVSFTEKGKEVLNALAGIVGNKKGVKFAGFGSKSKRALTIKVGKLEDKNGNKIQGSFQTGLNDVTITLNEDMLSDVNTSHELMHFLTYNELNNGKNGKNKLNKVDRELINEFRTSIALDDVKFSGNMKDNPRIKDLIEMSKQELTTELDYKFNMELVALLATEPEVRRFFADNIKDITNGSKSEAKISRFNKLLRKIVEAFEHVKNFINVLKSEDNFNGSEMSTADKVKYERIYNLLGNLLKNKQVKDTTDISNVELESSKNIMKLGNTFGAENMFKRNTDETESIFNEMLDYLFKSTDVETDKSAIKEITDTMNNLNKSCG